MVLKFGIRVLKIALVQPRGFTQGTYQKSFVKFRVRKFIIYNCLQTDRPTKSYNRPSGLPASGSKLLCSLGVKRDNFEGRSE